MSGRVRLNSSVSFVSLPPSFPPSLLPPNKTNDVCCFKWLLLKTLPPSFPPLSHTLDQTKTKTRKSWSDVMCVALLLLPPSLVWSSPTSVLQGCGSVSSLKGVCVYVWEGGRGKIPLKWIWQTCRQEKCFKFSLAAHKHTHTQKDAGKTLANPHSFYPSRLLFRGVPEALLSDWGKAGVLGHPVHGGVKANTSIFRRSPTRIENK